MFERWLQTAFTRGDDGVLLEFSQESKIDSEKLCSRYCGVKFVDLYSLYSDLFLFGKQTLRVLKSVKGFIVYPKIRFKLRA